LALSTKTPHDLAVPRRANHATVPHVPLALTTAACDTPAAVVVRDDVVAFVGWIVAGTDPGNRRHFGAGRTGSRISSIAGAERAVHSTIAPIVASTGISGVLRVAGALRWVVLQLRRRAFCGPSHRQQRDRARAGKESSKKAEHAPPRGSRRKPANQFLRHPINAIHNFPLRR